jgi:hypothetical protein
MHAIKKIKTGKTVQEISAKRIGRRDEIWQYG